MASTAVHYSKIGLFLSSEESGEKVHEEDSKK